jgi:polysaccharide chain length determinant protein (PEP-CTERM system associated)
VNGLDLRKYQRIAGKRKWWIIIPFLITCLGGLAYGLITPKVYEAKTLILVQPPRVPQDFVRPIVSEGVDERLRTISQQVTSRTNLENIVREHNLYAEPKKYMDEKIELFREDITIEVSQGDRLRRVSEPNAFTIAYRSNSPGKAMEIANILASNFISENLRTRESQATGTSSFLADELENVHLKLADKEEELKRYREKFMGGLPEQLTTNLKILERLQAQLDQLQYNLRDAENRHIVLQKEMTDSGFARPAGSTTREGESRMDLATLKSDLIALEARYTANHPDVIRTRETIAKMKAAKKELGTDKREDLLANADPTLKRQVGNVDAEIKALRVEIGKVASEINWYQNKVEETPKREQELLSLNRDYQNLKDLYDSLLKRKLEAEIAVSMEKKQQGEQFRVIDPAKEPQLPVKPDPGKLILATLLLALGIGGGLAYLAEMTDTSYRTPEELETDVGVPVLLTMPMRYTEAEIARRKKREIVTSISVGVGFVVCAILIILATKGAVDALNYVKTVLE